MDHRLLAAVAAFVLLVLLWRGWPARRWPTSMPYARRHGLLSRGELAFYRVLSAAIPKGTLLCPKVRLADVVFVAPDAWDRYGRPVAGKHVDFVLADAATTAVLLVVELDDRSHQRRDRAERDALVDAVLASAGVPLLRVRAAPRYEAEVLRRRIEEALGLQAG